MKFIKFHKILNYIYVTNLNILQDLVLVLSSHDPEYNKHCLHRTITLEASPNVLEKIKESLHDTAITGPAKSNGSAKSNYLSLT